MADSPTERRLEALSGGAPLSQAATMKIARQLLGPDLAERYGDVVGGRPVTAGDVARDFAIGAISRDPGKADAIKAQVYQQYNDQLRKEEDQANQRTQAAAQKMNSWFKLLEVIKSAPKDARRDLYTTGYTQIFEEEPASPLMEKIVTQYEKFGDAHDLLTDPVVAELAEKDPLAAVDQMKKMGADDLEAWGAIKDLQAVKAQAAQTQRVVAETTRLDRSQAETPQARRRATFIAQWANREVVDENDPSGLTKRRLAYDEVIALADQYYPEGGAPTPPAGIAQPAPVPPAPAAAGPVSTTVTPTTTGARGIRQLTEPAAAAPAPARPSITGTVTRIE